MEKLVRYGFILVVVSLIGFTILSLTPRVSYANIVESELGYTPAEKAAAIAAANNAIRRLPDPAIIVAYEQAYIEEVARAFALVQQAREEFHAQDADFPDLAKLYKAEHRVFGMLAIRDAQLAIDKIPPADQITEEHWPLIIEARRLTRIAMEVYGATEFDLCWRYDRLKAAEEKVEDVPEPEPPKPKPEPRPIPIPPTGGGLLSVFAGLALCAAGTVLIWRRKLLRRGKH